MHFAPGEKVYLRILGNRQTARSDVAAIAEFGGITQADGQAE